MRDPIYKPKGAALEYANYALNIYTGCPHRCDYCYVPSVLRMRREAFHSVVQPRNGILEAVREQLSKGKIRDKLIHLCFSCDPYPRGYDSSITRELIRAIKAAGNHVQILTKNPIERDFDLLDGEDWFGVTISGLFVGGSEPGSMEPGRRLEALLQAHERGIRTWISAEPVIKSAVIYWLLKNVDFYDRIMIGRMNYQPSAINWKAFGMEAQRLAEKYNRNYVIKSSLRQEIRKSVNITDSLLVVRD